MSTKWTRSRLSDVVDISDRVRRGKTGIITNAEEGSVAVSSLEVDDPLGDLEIANLHGFYGFETTAPTDQTCFYRGFVGDWTLGRGEADRTGAARRYTVESGDQNSILSRRIFRPTDTAANRPAETDAVRIAWLLGTPQMTHIEEDTYVNTSGAVAMDATDYRHQTPFDVLSDVSQQSGKNFWVMFVESGGLGGGTFGLWYDFDSSEEYATDLRISNYPGDEDEDTYYPFLDAELKRIAQRVFSGIDMQYDGGAVFVERDATGDAYQYRDTTSYATNVKTSTKATARANRMLNIIKTPEDRITCTILVCREDVNRLREGHRVECRFSHLTGYQDWTWMRVLNRTVSDIATDDFYTIKVEMSAEPALPPASCATISGNIAQNESTMGNGTYTPDTPSAPDEYPAVVIAMWGNIRGDWENDPGTLSVDAPYAEQYIWVGPDSHHAVAVGYEAVSSGVSEFSVTQTIPFLGANGTVSISFPTSATAPVQSGFIDESGLSVPLGAPPTAGNLLVAARAIAVGPGGGYTVPDGWVDGGILRLTSGDFLLGFIWRCAEEGESENVEVGNGLLTFWCSLTEWEL